MTATVSGIHQIGTHAARPAATAVQSGTLYSCSDHNLIYRSDGSAWSTWATLGAAAAAFVGVRATANAVTAVANATWAAVAFAAEDFDTDAFHDTITNNSRLTVPAGQAGTYAIGSYMSFAGNATGQRGARIILGGATVIAQEMRANIGGGGLPSFRASFSTIYALAAADYVEVQVWQNSGGSLDASADTNFWMHKIR